MGRPVGYYRALKEEPNNTPPDMIRRVIWGGNECPFIYDIYASLTTFKAFFDSVTINILSGSFSCSCFQ
nr:unnamed protein product [Spirometra erinaceieuropaei]